MSLLDGVQENDLRRFAACYLCSDRTGIDWEAAATAFKPDSRVDTFKTVTSKATKRALDKAGTPVGNGDAATTKPKKAPVNKRKKAADEDNGAEDEPKPKKGKGGTKKKGKSPAALTEDDVEDVKAEEDEEV